MSLPTQLPDLDDSINVAEAHGRVVREAAACAREKRIADNGIAPVSLWAIAACGVVLLIAGGILGDAFPMFSYDHTFREAYIRKPAPGLGVTGPAPKDALAAYSAKGAKVFSTKCQGCHGPDAKGNGSTFPSLAGTPWPNGETERFAMIILNGLTGPVHDGKTYGVMPPQGIGMSAEDLAGVMTYVRNNFGNSKGDVVTLEMAKAAMDISSKRKSAGQMVSAAELEADHLKDLPGAKLDPKTMLDPITLQPAKVAP
jgi:mono/diheme cytochrome c family protein